MNRCKSLDETFTMKTEIVQKRPIYSGLSAQGRFCRFENKNCTAHGGRQEPPKCHPNDIRGRIESLTWANRSENALYPDQPGRAIIAAWMLWASPNFPDFSRRGTTIFVQSELAKMKFLG